jgi:23S rRNA pseudouridine1911/1915/1917 synthase
MAFQQWMIDSPSVGMRLDLFLARHFVDGAARSGVSRSGIQRMIAEGQVRLNRQRAKSSARLKLNDVVEIENIPPREIPLKPESLALNILYEDEDCIVINKAPGMVVHPAAGRSSGTLVNALLHHCPDLQGIGGERRPGIVHRLDKDTSGAMIIAKSDMAYQQLARQFKERSVSKEYLALVWGKLEPATGIIDRPIGRHRSDRKKMSSVYFLAKRRPAVTEWSVEKYFMVPADTASATWLSWLRLKPRTGRTHQIRVHLADLKYPLVGDKVYARIGNSRATVKEEESRVDIFSRQALHAEKLEIDHPRSGERMKFFAPLADDPCELLRDLEIRRMTIEAVFTYKRG